MTDLTSLTDDAVAGWSETAGEPAWLRDTRLTAFKRFADQAWPDSRLDEYWRSTRFERFATDLPVITEVGGAPDDLDRDGLTASTDHAALVRIWDGGVVEALIGPTARAQGVIVTDLRTAAQTHADLVRAHLGSLTTTNPDGTGADEDRTITASDAAWTAGVFVYVPDEVEVDGPIGIRVHASSPGAHLPRVLVVLGHHATADVYLEHTGGNSDRDAAVVVDEVAEFVVGDAASLNVVSLQEWDDSVAHLSLQKAALHRGATYRHLAVQIGGNTVRIRPEVDLVGSGASCRPLGVYFADEGQHFDMQPYIRHIAPHCTSDVLFKGALQGKAKTVFRGNVWVGKDAVGTDTNETNRSLILSDGAKADSTPFLEILCADIRAGHGSATGQLDEDHLFYLQARGIPRVEAVRLIVFGFFREVLDEVDLVGVRERTMAHIEREIETADLARIGVTHRSLRPEPAEVA